MSEEDKAKWDALWLRYEQQLASEFLDTTDPQGLWSLLRAARDFKRWAEGLEHE